MKKENILVLAIICIAIMGAVIYNNMNSAKYHDSATEKGSIEVGNISGIDWQDYAQGVALAKTRSKPVFLYFHADWCTYCKQLKKTTFKNKKVLSYLNDNFISISVDTDKNKELATQWKVRGLPTLWFLKPDNSKITSIPGYIDEKQFLNILKYIHTASYDKMSFQEFVKII